MAHRDRDRPRGALQCVSSLFGPPISVHRCDGAVASGLGPEKPLNPRVVGSSPTGPTTLPLTFAVSCGCLFELLSVFAVTYGCFHRATHSPRDTVELPHESGRNRTAAPPRNHHNSPQSPQKHQKTNHKSPQNGQAGVGAGLDTALTMRSAYASTPGEPCPPIAGASTASASIIATASGSPCGLSPRARALSKT